jgi:hypothetical protein
MTDWKLHQSLTISHPLQTTIEFCWGYAGLQVQDMEFTKYFHSYGCLWFQGSRWPPSHFEKLGITFQVARTATEIDVDDMDSIAGNNDKIGWTTLNERAKLTGDMPQLKSKSEILECHALKMSVLPFLFFEVSHQQLEEHDTILPQEHAMGYLGEISEHIVGTLGECRYSPCNGTTLAQHHRKCMAPIADHVHLTLAHDPGNFPGICRAKLTKGRPIKD